MFSGNVIYIAIVYSQVFSLDNILAVNLFLSGSIMWAGFPWFREQSVDSWQLADIFLKTQWQHSCQEWKIELHSRIIMVCIIKGQLSIPWDRSPDTSYHLCCLHSGESPSRSVGEDIQFAIILRWNNLDKLHTRSPSWLEGKYML